MRSLLFLAVSFCLLVGWTLAAPPNPTASQDIDAAILRGIERGDCPGVVVEAIYKGQIFHRKAYGKARVEPKPQDMKGTEIFDLASLTKPIATALAIHLLVHREKIQLDAPVARYRPSFGKKDKEKITVEQLLLHTSGLAAGNPVGDYAEGLPGALKKIDELSLLDPPGSRFRYSDINYILLGHLVEATSGQPLDKFCHENIFEPLGMKMTRFNPPAEWADRCVPTEKIDGTFLVGVVHDPRARKLGGVAGHAGLFSTVADMGIFARMILNQGKKDGKQVIPAEVVRRYTTPVAVPLMRGQNPPQGRRTLGFDVSTPYSSNRGQNFSPETSFGHTGFTGTSLWIDPASGSAVIFLSSRLHPNGKGNVTRLRGAVATAASAK